MSKDGRNIRINVVGVYQPSGDGERARSLYRAGSKSSSLLSTTHTAAHPAPLSHFLPLSDCILCVCVCVLKLGTYWLQEGGKMFVFGIP